MSDAATTTTALPGEIGIAPGRWTVDPSAGHLAFMVKTMWGLVAVKGSFSRFAGFLTVADGAVSGELTIEAASLDTKNAMRDKHLRSADFFDVDGHPTITFSPASVSARDGGLTISGELTVGERSVTLDLPVSLEQTASGALRLSTHAHVTRESLALTWNRLGMIRGQAHLDADIELVPAV